MLDFGMYRGGHQWKALGCTEVVITVQSLYILLHLCTATTCNTIKTNWRRRGVEVTVGRSCGVMWREELCGWEEIAAPSYLLYMCRKHLETKCVLMVASVPASEFPTPPISRFWEAI